MPSLRRFFRKKGKEKSAKKYVMLENKSPVMEAYRVARTNIEFSDVGNKKSILITSSVPNEGKSTSTINLARTFAQAGKRTLIIDLDLRKPVIHKIFDLDGDIGFTTVVLDKAKVNQAILKTQEENLYVMPSGVRPVNPVDFLSSDKSENLISFLKTKFDIVIVDSPPAMNMADASILSTYVDSTIVVTSANHVDYRCVQKTLNILQNVNANVVGVILNNLKLVGSSYKYKYSKYNYYY